MLLLSIAKLTEEPESSGLLGFILILLMKIVPCIIEGGDRILSEYDSLLPRQPDFILKLLTYHECITSSLLLDIACRIFEPLVVSLVSYFQRY